MKLLSILLISFFILSCAAAYKPPTFQPINFTKQVNASKNKIFSVSKQILALEGYQIQNSDKESGILTTTFLKMMKLDGSHCDCGTTMGIPYTKDKRTITHISISIIAQDNRITIKANITGEYLKNDPAWGKSFDCISKGKIESELFRKIKSQL